MSKDSPNEGDSYSSGDNDDEDVSSDEEEEEENSDDSNDNYDTSDNEDENSDDKYHALFPRITRLGTASERRASWHINDPFKRDVTTGIYITRIIEREGRKGKKVFPSRRVGHGLNYIIVKTHSNGKIGLMRRRRRSTEENARPQLYSRPRIKQVHS